MNGTQRDFVVSQRRLSRRRALQVSGGGMAATLGAATVGRVLAQEGTPVAAPEAQTDLAEDGLSAEIIEVFGTLPGTNGLKLWAPPDAGRPAWSATLNAERRLFIASAFKVFVLAEYLRQVEEALDPMASTPLASQLNARLAEELTLDETVFSPGSSVFNPPHLTGKVTARTVLEAMISHSDNTAADMALKQVGPDRVRQLIAAEGLHQTQIPASTRELVAYISGDPAWQSVTWTRVQALLSEDPYPQQPILNDTITMASSADDLVAFYARALQGAVFRYPETLAVFRAILALADAIPLSMPLGVNAFLKGGSLAFAPNNALTVAGGLYVPNRWVYYATLFNWTDAEWGSIGEVQDLIATRLKTIFTLVRDRLGS